MGGKRHQNRVFDMMGLCYADREGPSTSLPVEEVAPSGCGAQGQLGQKEENDCGVRDEYCCVRVA